MDKIGEFLQMAEFLCKHPHLLCGGTFYEVSAYLLGYANGSTDCPLSNDGGKAFCCFVCRHFRFPDKYAWPYVLKMCSKDDDDARLQLLALLTEFCDKTRTMSYDEILQGVTPKPIDESDKEAERTMRQFLGALFRGDRREIEPLILEHPDAAILWKGAYPPGVAEQLESISMASPIGRLPVSGDDGEVQLVTADFPFPIRMKRIDGQWKVDSSTIIEVRKGAQEMRKRFQEEQSRSLGSDGTQTSSVN